VFDPQGPPSWPPERGFAGPPSEPTGIGDAPPPHDGPLSPVGAGAAPPPLAVLNQRIVSLLEVLLCSGFPTQLAIVAGLIAAGVPPFDADGRLSLAHVVLLSLVDTVVLVALIVWLVRLRGERPGHLLLGTRSVLKEARVGLLLVPAAFAIVIVTALAIERLAPWLRSADGNPLEDLLRDPRHVALLAFVVVVAGGLREEVQRAFILHRFEQHLGGAAAGLLLFSIAFGFGHALQGWDAAVTTALLGALWGIVYLRRRSIVAAAVCHASFNLLEVVFHGIQA
jgi:membrane protease YdiL (CAAX protease family)